MIICMCVFLFHPNKQYIQWSFYEKVFSYDSKTMLKVCLKLTKSHFDLNNLTKMKVKFASQVNIIFSGYNIKTGNCTILEGIQNPLNTVNVSLSTISYKVLSIN